MFFIIVMIIDTGRFVTREYVITTDKIRHAHTLVFLTDLHAKVYGRDNEAVVEAVRHAAPEAILCGGDMVTGSKAGDGDRWYASVISLLKRLRATAPVFCVNGNHELKIADPLYYDYFGDGFKRYERELNAAGIRICRNGCTTLAVLSGGEDDNIDIYGMETEDFLYRKFRRRHIDSGYVRQRLGTPSLSRFNIVVSHHPKDFDALAEWGADLVTSGHIHGGVMRLPGIGGIVSPDPALFPKYSGGLYEHSCSGGRKSRMVLSCGLGTHTIPVRIFNPAEISVIRLIPANGKD
jgi:predicted MPP superfamily phosphohydrolase